MRKNSAYTHQNAFTPFVIVIFLLINSVVIISSGKAAPLSEWLRSSRQPQAEQAVHRAWQNLSQADRYEHSTTVEHITYPAPSLANVGQSSTRETYTISGQVDTKANAVQLTLWQNAGSLLNRQDVIELRLSPGQAQGRVAGGEWRDLDTVDAASFKLNNSVMPILAATRAAREQETQERWIPNPDGSQSLLTVTRYTFELDGNKFAEYMRDQMAAELQRSGKLQAGMRLSLSEKYRAATGSGEVWISSDGLPVHLTVHLQMPAERSGERVESTIRADFYNVHAEQLLAATTWPQRLLHSFDRALASIDFAQIAGVSAISSLLLLVILLATLHARRRWVYALTATFMMVSMLVTPLWQSASAASFTAEMSRRQEKEKQALPDAVQPEAWPANTDPLDTAPSTTALLDASQPAAAVNSVLLQQQPVSSDEEEKDTDGDGLPDSYEDNYPYALDKNTADQDNDGLNDGAEFRLGTLPREADSDGDGIWDNDEVKGFSLDGQTWYTNPMNNDTDGDGQSDGVECPQRIHTTDPGWTAGICQDTDNDGTPDIFDLDDDNDGVPTISDLSPYTVSTKVYDRDKPFSFSIAGLETGLPVMIDFQLRPDDPKHLTYALSVLDWPSGDVEGQIQRVSDTTFANTSNVSQRQSDPRAANGDMRLIPMLELRLTGEHLPLPLKDSYSFTFEEGDFSGELTLTSSSGNSTLTVNKLDRNSSPAAGIELLLAEGTCKEFSPVQPPFTASAGSDPITLLKSLGDLADGRFVLAGFDDDSKTYEFCTPVPAYAHGKYRDHVVDQGQFENYGGFVRQDEDGSVLAYLPLTVVYDEAGSDPVAFTARAPFINRGGAFNGLEQEARLVWLLNMLVDVCKPAPAGYNPSVQGEWCDPAKTERWYIDQPEIVHAYPDSFHLTGLSVVEEHGSRMAVIYEDPAAAAIHGLMPGELLWALADGLSGSFAAGRRVLKDGVLVLSPDVDEIKDRFNYGSTASQNLRWGLPANAFHVRLYDYESLDAMFRFPTSQVKDLLGSITNAPASLTLLFARQIVQRTAGVEDSEAAGGSMVIDFSEQKSITHALLNWAPYRKTGSGWESFPLDEYLDTLEASLRTLGTGDYTPGADEEHNKDVIDGKIIMARFFYEAMARGLGGVVQIGDLPVENFPSIKSELDVVSPYSGYLEKGKLILKVYNQVAEAIVNGVKKLPHNQWGNCFRDHVLGFFQAVALGMKLKVTDTVSKVQDLLAKTWLKVALFAAGALITVATLAVLYVRINFADTPAGRIAQRLIDTGIKLVSVGLAIKGLYEAVKAVKAMYQSGQLLTRAAVVAQIIGLIVEVAIIWCVMVVTAILGHVSVTSVMFTSLVADAIAATLIALLVFALCLTQVGQLVMAVIGLIDSILAAVCTLLGVPETSDGNFFKQYVCIGINGWMVKIAKWMIYSQTFLIDYDNPQRLSITNFNLALTYPERGFTTDNFLWPTYEVHNTITKSGIPFDWKAAAYFWQYSDLNARSAAFAYRLQTSETDFSDELERHTMNEVWEDVEEDKWTGRFTAQPAGEGIPMTEPGINRRFSLYFSEAAAVPVQECWEVPTPPVPTAVCYIRTEKLDYHTLLDQELVFDVFPATLDEFYSLVKIGDGYTLAWGQEGTLKFPPLRDADGDQLVSKELYGGNDPDDSKFDTDGDGLSDYYELTHSMIPTNFDTDGDGLKDGDELALGTSPFLADTDGDGLDDGEEIAGWMFTYGYAANQVLETRVYPNPLVADADMDGLTDFIEFNLGFNPNAPSDAEWLTNELSLRETEAPQVLLRLNEAPGATLFNDASSYAHHGTCSGEACPAAGLAGRYGAAASFDGNDYISMPAAAKAISLFDKKPFTLAAWIKHTGSDGALLTESIDYPGSLESVYWRLTNGHLEIAAMGGAPIPTSMSTGSVPAGEWTHVAAAYDGSRVTFYINGEPQGMPYLTTPFTGNGVETGLTVGALLDLGGNPIDFYTGQMDDLAVFDYALNQEQIQALMGAAFNLDDSIVLPGQNLAVQAKLTNKLDRRWTHSAITSLIEPLEKIVDGVSKLLPSNVRLSPAAPAFGSANSHTVSEIIQVSPAASSGPVNITQMVYTAAIDPSIESNGASLWLKFAEGAGARSFADSSGVLKPLRGTCTICPRSGEAGIFNNAVRFAAGSSQDVSLPSIAELGLVNSSFTLSLWVNPGRPDYAEMTLNLLSTGDGSLNIKLNNWDIDYKPYYMVKVAHSTGSLIYDYDDRIYPDRWTMITLRYDIVPRKLELFINGLLVKSKDNVSPLAASSLKLGGGFSKDLLVDELYVYPRALSLDEINRLFGQAVLYLPMNSSFEDESGYDQEISSYGQPTSAVTMANLRGNSLATNSLTGGAGYLRVNGNTLLDASDGLFSFSTWIYPYGGSSTGNDWEGIWGGASWYVPNYNEKHARAKYPALERQGRKLRFSFGPELRFFQRVTGDVLQEDAWNHVAVTLRPNPSQPGKYEYALYVNGAVVDSQADADILPVSDSPRFFVGTSSEDYYMYLDSIEYFVCNAGARFYIYRTTNYGTGETWRSEELDYGVPSKCTVDVRLVQSFNNGDTFVKYDVYYWEDDNYKGSIRTDWWQGNQKIIGILQDGYGGDGARLYARMERPSVPFRGLIDEFRAYTYALNSAEVRDLYNNVRATVSLALDEPPASTSFANAAAPGDSGNGVCSPPGCPRTGLMGIDGQSAYFDGVDDRITAPASRLSEVISFWVKTDCPNCGLATYTYDEPYYEVTTPLQFFLREGKLCILLQGDGVPGEVCKTDTNLADGKWHQVVYATLGTAMLFLAVDGKYVFDHPPYITDSSGKIELGYAAAAEKSYYQGELDQFIMIQPSTFVPSDPENLDEYFAAMVGQIPRNGPRMLFHFDEAAPWVDSTPNQYYLYDYQNGWAVKNVEGRIGQSLEFNSAYQDSTGFGMRRIWLHTSPKPVSTDLRSFSAAMWFMPYAVPDRDMGLVVIRHHDPDGYAHVRYAVGFLRTGQLCVADAQQYITPPYTYPPVNGDIYYGCDYEKQSDSNAPKVLFNQWNHLVFTVARTGLTTEEGYEVDRYEVYLNGSKVLSGTNRLKKDPDTNRVDNSLGSVDFGNLFGAFLDTGSGTAQYTGRIDEFSFYDYVLDENTVRALYRYQAGLDENVSTAQAIVDNDLPSVDLVSYNPAFPYLAETDRLLQVDASDPTSSIQMVEMQVKSPGGNAPDWSLAPVCQDSISRENFCPTFDPTAGEGVYEVSFRAVDAVSHQTQTEHYPFYVDGTPPAASFDQEAGSLLSAELVADQKNTWAVRLSGSLSDPALAGNVSGSGIDPASVQVTLYSEAGEVVGAGAQTPVLTATETGFDWTLDYVMPEHNPSGQLTAVLNAADRVGNSTTKELTFLLEAMAPRAAIDRTAEAQRRMEPAADTTPLPLLGPGSTITGTVSDLPVVGDPNNPYVTENGLGAASGVNKVEVAFQPAVNTSFLFNEPYPDGVLAWLPLDYADAPRDENGQPNLEDPDRTWLDISPSQTPGTCSGDECPQEGIAGHRQGSAYFDGQQRLIRLGEMAHLPGSSFSVLTWARRGQTGREDPLVWQGDASGGTSFLLGFRADDKMVCKIGETEIVSPQAVAGQYWSQWACIFDAQTGQAALYHDGQIIASGAAAAAPGQDDTVQLGRTSDASFHGYLDEVLLLDRALDSGEIETLYAGYHTVLQATFDESFVVDGSSLADISGFFHDLAFDAGEKENINRSVPGKVGDFALELSGGDEITVLPSPALDLSRGAFTQSAWVFPDPDAAFSEAFIFGDAGSDPSGGYPTLSYTSDYRLWAGFGDGQAWNGFETPDPVLTPGVWNFVSATFDGARYLLYVNGVEVARYESMAGKKPSASGFPVLGRGLVGALDDVRIYARALSALEIQALAQEGWFEANLDPEASTWSATTPEALEGPYRINVRAWDALGHVSAGLPDSEQWDRMVDTLAPRVVLDPNTNGLIGQFSFRLEDLTMDTYTIQFQPDRICPASPIYNNSLWSLATGLPVDSLQIGRSGQCRLRGQGSVEASACDRGGQCSNKVLDYDLSNLPPVAEDVQAEVVEDTPTPVTLKASDPNGDPITFEIVTDPQHGELSGTAPNLIYTPDENYTGSDTFTYRASDEEVHGPTATVTINVTPVNDAPAAEDDSYTTAEDTALDVPALTGVLSNDQDVDRDPLTATLVTGPEHGTLTLNADGSFTYTPDENWYGTDAFTYRANDGTASSTAATVTITVEAVNDAPAAEDDSYTTDEDTALEVPVLTGVLSNDQDVEDDPLTATLVTGPDHGVLTLDPDGSFTYTPDENWYGTDAFTYRASDEEVDGNEATVTIEVIPVNDAPAAADDSYATDEDTVLEVPALTGVLSNDEDVENDPITAVKATDPEHGTLTLNADGSFTYTPDEDWYGTDTFTYQASDGTASSTAATVTIEVAPVNDAAPAVVDDSYTTAEDTVLKVPALTGVLSNDEDVDRDPITAVKVSDPEHGTLKLNADGSFTYTPDENWNGTDTFTYRASDGMELSVPATVTITVEAVNDAPVFQPVDDPVINEEEPFTLDLAAVDCLDDPANAIVSYTMVSGPEGASVDPDTGRFSFTPSEEQGPGFYPVTVRATDDGVPAASGEVTFNVEVLAANDLSLAVSAAPEPVLVGEHVAYTLAIENLSPDPGTGLVVTARLPQETSFTASRSSRECSAAGREVRCLLAAISPGGKESVTIVARVNSAGDGNLIRLEAELSADQADHNLANNTALLTTATMESATVYDGSQEDEPGDEWQEDDRKTTIAPNGQKLMGLYNNEEVVLTLTDLPAHSTVIVEFDLAIVGSWDGNYLDGLDDQQLAAVQGHSDYGPDIWEFVADDRVLLHTTFSNWNYYYQAYPDNYPGGKYPARTGSLEVGTLGYSWYNETDIDSLYRLYFSFNHTGSDLVLRFRDLGLQPLNDESWGLANVKVTLKGAAYRCYLPMVSR